MAIVMDSFSESNQTSTFAVTASGGFNQGGQTFTGDGNLFYSAVFYIDKVGAPTGPMVANIYNVTGTYGTTACLPTGSPILTSSSIDCSTLSTSLALVEFVFPSGTSSVNGTHYAVTLDVSGTNTNGATRIPMGQNLSGGHAGNRVVYDNSFSNIWSGATFDICFYVYGVQPSSSAGGFLIFEKYLL